MVLQGDQLTMTSLGLVAADQIEAGVHLRWQMGSALGFPPYGFELYRRDHAAADSVCVKVSAAGHGSRRLIVDDLTITSDELMRSIGYGSSGFTAIVVDAAATLTVSSAQPMQSYTVTTEQPTGSVRLVALDEAMPVARATIPAPGGTATLSADRFTRVEIRTEGETGFRELCHTLVSDATTTTGWGTPLVTLNLPPNWATAAARIPTSWHARYEPSFDKLLTVIELLRRGPRRYSAVGTPAPAPSLMVAPLQLLLLAALDPGIARMLGLAYLDTTAAVGTVYDYKILGRWDRTGLDPKVDDHSWICFNVARGTPPAVPVPTGLTVQARSISGGLVDGVPSANQSLAVLTWTIPGERPGGLQPGAAVRYHLYRQRQRPSGWSAATRLTEAQPLLVPVGPGGSRPTDYYVDGPLPAAVFRYQVQGIDLFGRLSDRSAPVPLTLTDTVAPPPPLAVAARALAAGSRAELSVSWQWPAERRAQAGDAATFRVYYQTTNIRPLLGTITAITRTTLVGGTSEVTTDLPASGDYGRYVGGYLVNSGQRFPIRSLASAGASLALTLGNIVTPDGQTLRPRAATTTADRGGLAFVSAPGALPGRFFLQVDWSDPAHWQRAPRSVPVTAAARYGLTVPGVPLTTSALTPVAYALVGVATVDAAGNEGPLSAPVTVALAHTLAPATPAAAAGTVYATRADYHGYSRYTLTIDPSENGLYYDIYRALDATILAKAGMATASDDALRTLADGHEAAFTRLDTRDTTGAPLTGTGGALSYTDQLPGTGGNRYVYKVQVVDRAGNRSPLSTGLVVHLIDTVPPRPPVVTAVTGGDRQITLCWARNREADLALYRLYRTTDAAAATDLRLMPLVASFILDEAAATVADRAVAATAALTDDGAGQLGYTDTGLTGRVDTFYRLVAVDTAGNVSPATRLIMARAYDTVPSRGEASHGI